MKKITSIIMIGLFLLGHTSLLANNIENSLLQDALQQYMAVKDALVKSDQKLTAASSKLFATSLEAVKMDQLTSEEHTVWMKVGADLKELSQQMAVADLKQQRNLFIQVTSGMYALVKSAKLESATYYQYCPMANNGKGANWLSKENQIKNPYYGNQMLSCGKVVETIK